MPLIEGQEDLVAWLACPCCVNSQDPLHEDFTRASNVCKNFEGVKFLRVKLGVYSAIGQFKLKVAVN